MSNITKKQKQVFDFVNTYISENGISPTIEVIKKQSVAENGQTVVAIIDDNEATLKKLYREKARYRLEARNPNMPSLFRTDVEVRGVVVQVISKIIDKPEKIVSKKTKHGFRTIDLF